MGRAVGPRICTLAPLERAYTPMGLGSTLWASCSVHQLSIISIALLHLSLLYVARARGCNACHSSDWAAKRATLSGKIARGMSGMLHQSLPLIASFCFVAGCLPPFFFVLLDVAVRVLHIVCCCMFVVYCCVLSACSRSLAFCWLILVGCRVAHCCLLLVASCCFLLLVFACRCLLLVDCWWLRVVGACCWLLSVAFLAGA